MTPLERPAGIDQPQLDEAETAAFERRTALARAANVNNGYDWWDNGAAHLDRRRTSLIVDPADGHLPPLTPEAQRRQRVRRDAAVAGPEELSLNTRCIWWSNAGPPMVPSPYNNNVQFIETRDYVVISNENIHDARIIPLDGRAHGSFRLLHGDSLGRWEGDALVVDTINFTTKTSLNGSDENLHVVERFQLIDANTLDYRFTVEDSTLWKRSWTAMLRFHRSAQPIYEFACHEGNFRIMEGILRAARLSDTP